MKQIFRWLVASFQIFFYVGIGVSALAFVFQFFTDMITFRTFGNILLSTIGFYGGYFLFYRIYYGCFAQEPYETLPEQLETLDTSNILPK